VYFNFDSSECLYCDILDYDTVLVYCGRRVLVCGRNAEKSFRYGRNLKPDYTLLDDKKLRSNSLDLLR